MSIYNQYKYKDCSPEETIKNVENILQKINIEVIINHQVTLKHFHSVFLQIKGTNLFTNGKGTTYEYALASAYGELMERLQNYALYSIRYDISEEANRYNDFYYSPDEKYLHREELLENQDFVELFLKNINNEEERKEILLKVNELSTINDGLICLPLYEYKSNRPVLVPSEIISNFYATNGMCAGNTREEALIQGLSEIYERYVNKIIYYEKIVPPTVNKEYIKGRYPQIHKMITEIEINPNYQLIVKDCSLDGKFPVVGVVLIDRVKKRYMWKFGAHPIIEIALERTLTELFQGRELEQMMDMKSFTYIQSIKQEENFEKILISGEGYYPTEIFSEEFSYEFRGLEFVKRKTISNQELLEGMVETAYKNGLTILIRDVSFLKFPSYHIIVPCVSNIKQLNKRNCNELIEYKKIKDSLKKTDLLEKSELERVISYLQNKSFNNKDSILRLFGLPLDSKIPLYSMKTGLFMACAYYKLNEYKTSFMYMKEFVKFIQNNFSKMDSSYYECARDFIGGMAKSDRIDYIQGVLEKFYSKDLISKVLKDLERPEMIFKNIPVLDCYNCEDCRINNYCYHPNIMAIHKTLKTVYKGYYQRNEEKIS